MLLSAIGPVAAGQGHERGCVQPGNCERGTNAAAANGNDEPSGYESSEESCVLMPSTLGENLFRHSSRRVMSTRLAPVVL